MMRVGDDFTSSIILDVLPGADIPSGIYYVEIIYNNQYQFNHSTMHTPIKNKKGLKIEFGKDVYSINLRIHKPSLSNEIFKYEYIVRLDNLILLNLAYRLIKLQ